LREIHIEKIIKIVKDLTIQANTELPDDVLSAFEEGLKKKNPRLNSNSKRFNRKCSHRL
jgi:tartrate dehydratase alpha subunit/fumarate hydratase class I-like protein